MTVVQGLENAIHRINRYLVDSAILFSNIYSLDSNLSVIRRYSLFEQLGSDLSLRVNISRTEGVLSDDDLWQLFLKKIATMKRD